MQVIQTGLEWSERKWRHTDGWSVSVGESTGLAGGLHEGRERREDSRRAPRSLV